MIRVVFIVPHVEQELPTFLEDLSSLSDCRGVRVALSLVFGIMLCRLLWPICLAHCDACPSIIAFDYPFCIFKLFCSLVDRIGDVMVSVLVSSAVDRGFEPQSVQTKGFKIGICCFSAKPAALRRKSKNWLARNPNNVSE